MSLTEFDEEIAIRGWREDGIEEGKTIGAQQKAVETIKNALEMNLSIEKIAKLVSLPVEKVLELQKQIKVNAQ